MRTIRLVRASLVAVPIMVALVGPALSATCAEVSFADSTTLGNAALVLNGLGLRKATIFRVRVYVAGLYLPAKSADPTRILGADDAWRMELRFLRSVGASDMREAFQEGFAKAAPDQLASLQQRIDALKAAMIDLASGQSLVFANDPKSGVAVEVNGAKSGAIAGADFARALLAIWIGADPPNADLKSGLLGGACA
jgi:long-chain acyl-CoA synthetase